MSAFNPLRAMTGNPVAAVVLVHLIQCRRSAALTSELNLIADLKLRNALARYYTNAAHPALQERPAYREHLRGMIPIDVQLYIWAKCYASDAQGEQYLRDCPSAVSEARAADIVNSIRRDRGLMSELRYWVSTMHVASLIGRDGMTLAREVLASVEAELRETRN